MAAVKAEAMIKPDPSIKPDPDTVTSLPVVMSDDDIYEDAGDLEFADLNPATNPAAADVYLTHVPKYLYEAWAGLDDDEEIRVGTVRKWIEVGKDGRQTVRDNLLRRNLGIRIHSNHDIGKNGSPAGSYEGEPPDDSQRI